MIMLRNDVLDFYHFPKMNGAISVEISSDNSNASDFVYSIIEKCYSRNCIVFKAYGLPNTINEIRRSLSQNECLFYEGDSKRFYMKKYPEIIMRIENNKEDALNTILQTWTCAANEGRFLYVVKPNSIIETQEILSNNAYSTNSNIEQIWGNIECVFEAVPESNNNNSFLFTFRKNDNGQIKNELFECFLK